MLTKLFHQHQYGRTDLDISCQPHQPLWVSREPFATEYKSYDPANAHTRDACWWEIYAVYQTGRRNHVVRQRKRKEIVKLNSLKKNFGTIFTFLRVHLHYLCFFHRNPWTSHYLQHSAFQTSAVQMYQEAVWIRWARLIADEQAPCRKVKREKLWVCRVCMWAWMHFQGHTGDRDWEGGAPFTQSPCRKRGKWKLAYQTLMYCTRVAQKCVRYLADLSPKI